MNTYNVKPGDTCRSCKSLTEPEANQCFVCDNPYKQKANCGNCDPDYGKRCLSCKQVEQVHAYTPTQQLEDVQRIYDMCVTNLNNGANDWLYKQLVEQGVDVTVDQFIEVLPITNEIMKNMLRKGN